MKIKFPLVIFIICFFSFFSCKNDDSNTSSFDTKAMLTDVTQDVILPNVNNFVTSISTLENSIATFTATPTAVNLNLAQNSWKSAAQQYAGIYSFNIGRPKELFMHQLLFNWPAFTIAIENAIASGTSIEIDQISSKAKGLTGIEYLLFGDISATNTNVLDSFSDQNRLNYLTAISIDLKNQANRLHSIWNVSGEDYATTFINNTDTGLQSSLNMLFNGLYNVSEAIKKAKLGKPAGLENTSATNPETLQAFRSGISLDLIEKNIKSIEAIYFNTNGIGLSNNVQGITGNEEINTKVRNQFESIYTALSAINQPLYLAIDVEKPAVSDAYNRIKELVILLNNEVGSTLSIIVTPTDNDGD